eukprot:CAMPEP_0172494308 /NCGR_PEP_ID=MMETSP1066-20121228/45212_1 /TAXON_ID=671091 /ORGANISM="Coscinodiscus wailesii, Strain CCMP2513" /LENGTH=60 /DNA_ID=CAMNT_0013265191 /DNA_START=91 /DNA_END=270 /DNA_ORIENTATION=-
MTMNTTMAIRFNTRYDGGNTTMRMTMNTTTANAPARRHGDTIDMVMTNKTGRRDDNSNST